MKIAVIGTGYVGLVTGTCLAESGNNVTCVDIDATKIKRMRAGEVPIYEPGLEDLFTRNIREGRLKFTTEIEAGVKTAEVIFLALPTPPAKDGSADLSFVFDVAKILGLILDHYAVVVNKSTVPPGTVDQIEKLIAAKAQVEFDVVHNPEFLREGFAVDDFMKPDRVVIGSHSDRANEVMTKLYKPFVSQSNQLYFMDLPSAEMTKYAANTFLAAKITFMNEIANVCEQVGADVDQVRMAIGADERIGNRFLFPGIGFGGSCFPKDVQALEHFAGQYGYQFEIMQAVMEVNEKQRLVLVNKIKKTFGAKLKGKTFALWGLAFKPDTDDVRYAPAFYIAEKLLEAGAKVMAFDPEAMVNTKKTLGNKIEYASDQYSALDGADALIIATEWSEFRSPDFDKMAKLLKSKTIFDGRNVYGLQQMQDLDWDYYSIGRPPVEAKS